MPIPIASPSNSTARHWEEIGNTTDTSLEWPYDAPGSAAQYSFRWKVQAQRDTDGMMVTFTMFEVPATFTIQYR